ncbi:MAG: DUF6605 domain-containing protein [Dermatophilaceae bacterium]
MASSIGTPGGTPARPAVFFDGPEEFRAWLDANHDSARELWLGLFKKHVADQGLTYAEAVREALCYGWIDSVAQRIDADATRQRFTPRRPGSVWSTVNIALVEELTAQGRMRPAGLAAFAQRRPERSGIYAYETGEGVLPAAYAAQLAANPLAAEWFARATPGYRRLAVHWVLSAKQEATRDRRMAELVDDCAHGRLIRSQRYGEEPGWVARNRAALGILLALVLALAAGCTGGGGSASSTAAMSARSASPGTSGAAPSRASTSPDATGRPPANWVEAENARPGDDGWNVGTGRTAPAGTLDGYADAASVLPGDKVTLRIRSTRGPVTVTAYRLGWYSGAGGRAVWRSAPVTAVVQPATPHIGADGMVTAGWSPSTTVDTTGWPEGTYVLRLDASQRAKVIPLTVRSREVADRLVVVNAVSTYQAYNQWGGASLYLGPDDTFGTRSARVSFDRPYDGNGAPILFKHEVDAIQWIEKQGPDLAYLTSIDLDTDAPVLRGARGVLSLGHDEYWSPAMRHTVEAARDAGTNLAFLGANAVYWRVRFDARHRVMTGTKDAGLDPGKGAATTVMWRARPDPRPENSLTGMLYECFPAAGPLVVTDPDFFLFTGTGAKAGSSYPGLIGTEIDRVYPLAGTPPTLHIAAHSPVACADRGRTYADLTYYTAPSGAGVVAMGSMLFTRALRGADPRFGITAATSDFARGVLGNLVGAMNVGPMAGHFPAVGNIAEFAPPATTSTGTGGPVG